MSFSLLLFITSIEKTKKKKRKNIISKKVLKETITRKLRKLFEKNNFNTTNSVDGHTCIGGKHIASYFKQ